jgi:hypothetical protein
MKKILPYLIIAVAIIFFSFLIARAAGELEVIFGGTGAGTFTDGGILLGNGTGAIQVLAVATNGQFPIGDGTTDPVLGTLNGDRSLTVTNGAGTIEIDADEELYTKTASINFIKATTTAAYAKATLRLATASTISEIGCYTDSGTSTLLFYEAAEITPNASSSSIIESIVCDTNMATTTTFVDSAIAARGLITAKVIGITASTNTVAWITYTIND